ncbi:flagellar hook assembly protein FlgD [Cytobacillus spongiae]|uniref:flagellar hook assembly protein FlgD n=1 Tax=Cytobacillus spongiae TaxID=2901381 RepID=UPI001F335593|nr:flagellar hook assembly protein FlgD [Cytobacillus spongiae]UII57414.1 flagellar hook assembly protein FlgD [Cytobacillus spongiae]
MGYLANSVDTSLMLSTYQQKQRKANTDILGKDDFLKILMTQLQNQDPLNPMEDKDFIAQMATFSSLEQMTNMAQSIEKFIEVQEQSKLISYSEFVGREITWHKLIESEDPSKEPKVVEGTGKVKAIQFKDNTVQFLLEDGTILEPGNISKINEVSADNGLLQASMLIGKTVTYVNDKQEEVTAVVKSASFKNGKTLFQLNDAAETSITSSQITKIE